MYLTSGATSSLQNALVKNGQASPETSNGAPTPSKGGSDMQSQLEQSLNRSITVVFWHQAKTEPIRLHLEIPTFPLFQLSQFPSFVTDLGLSSTSYVDAYNEHTGHWEQRNIATVRSVETDQRLLFRVRKSLLQGLRDEDCTGLIEEVERQPRVGSKKEPLKRPPEQVLESPGRHRKHQATEGYQQQQEYSSATYTHLSQSYPQSLSTPAPGPVPTTSTSSSTHPIQNAPKSSTVAPKRTHPPPNSPYLYTNNPALLHSYTPVPLPSYLTDPHAPSAPIAYHPHPPLKRWPNDYTVADLALGFRMMDTLSSSQSSAPAITQKVAFERVFGCRYVKSTVCRHRGVWRRADAAVRAEFEAMGSDDERALWGEFVRRVEGRAMGKASKHAGIDEPTGSAQDAADHQEGEEGEEAVMGSLGPAPPNIPLHQGTQGSPPSGNATQSQAMQIGANPVPIYDPALQV